MSKSLIIAEKPSVASDLARALGGFKKLDDHYENDRYIISSAVGHLVELCLPSELDVKRGKWSFANLPIIPDEFDLQPIEKTKARFNHAQETDQAQRRNDALINACDAGREGELIFRYLVKLTGSKKPIRRLWLQSMTAESIRTAFEHLRTNEEMIPLAKAAVCRSESDWLVGINGTRAMTAFNNKTGGFQLTPVGRVQTPDARDPGRARRKDSRFQAANIFRSVRRLRGQGRRLSRSLVPRGFREGRRRGCARRTYLGLSHRRGDQSALSWQNRHRDGRTQTDDAGAAVALRPNQFAAGGKWPRLQRQTHIADRAATLRATQSHYLSANRFALFAGRLYRDGEVDAGQDSGSDTRRACSQGSRQSMGQTVKAHFQQREDFRSLRHRADGHSSARPR